MAKESNAECGRIADDGSAVARLRVCLAGSGGGHVRQLLDLRPVWEEHNYFFVTEDTALGRSLSEEHRTHFVPHFAWGQARLGGLFRMLSHGAISFIRSAAIVWRERPHVIVSTGAGAVFPTLLLGRLFGARIVVIESFARFEKPSLFGRMAAPFAHDFVVQSPNLARHYPRAKVFDPLLVLDRPPQAKQDLIFVTVGATLAFDRMIASVAKLKACGVISERVIAQTGIKGLAPPELETFETLPFERVGEILRNASMVICHGGTGSLITALREGCHVIAMPRLARLGEHYDDHQSEIIEAFAKRGLILVANNPDELAAAVLEARSRPPVVATTDPVSLIAFLRSVITETRKNIRKRSGAV
jgi:UDP-N-acetylglucosamine--N-acetylmuramyl-(pentapeptide) pyrophosphoryl-undecaprenol N-acetylglucosamine transferase